MRLPRWTFLHPAATADMLGILPGFLDADDPARAREQLDRNYGHGGGWVPFPGHRLTGAHPTTSNPVPSVPPTLVYPGDPPMRSIAYTRLRDELIVLFEAEWVAIIQPDGTYEVARMD